MYLSELRIKNFRQFGDPGAEVQLQPGVSILAGPNDSGKTAIIDAIRYVLTTRDRDYTRIVPTDYHVSEAGVEAQEITISCKFQELTQSEKTAFLEYLTLEEDGSFSIYLTWTASPRETAGRKWSQTTLKCGRNGDGPDLDAEARALLACTYLRPLRDAESEMAPGRNSRLSRVLAATTDIDAGTSFDFGSFSQDPSTARGLSLSALYDLLRHLVDNHEQISKAKTTLNEQYLQGISLVHDQLKAEINFMKITDKARLQHILEKLELNLIETSEGASHGIHGLGSHNLLYIACELLLITTHSDGLPLLLIEEPEAHLHPQRQLQLMEFLQEKASPHRDTESGETTLNPMQIIITSHSPTLASKADVANIVLLSEQKAYPMTPGSTQLAGADYRFLQRFLDATKANLFFARGVIIVEGDAEELLLPTLARLLGYDLTKNGISIVNVRGTGLGRFTRIFQRAHGGTQNNPQLNIPVAALRDRDVMPNCAPEMLGYVKGTGCSWWTNTKRKLRVERDFPDFTEQSIEQYENRLRDLDGQEVKTFISDDWTLEYDLIKCGLAREMYRAIKLARSDDKLQNQELDSQPTSIQKLLATADEEFDRKFKGKLGEVEFVKIYEPLQKSTVSKSITAQYLAEILETTYGRCSAELAEKTPNYIISALVYVTKGYSGEY